MLESSLVNELHFTEANGNVGKMVMLLQSFYVLQAPVMRGHAGPDKLLAA